jgi:heparan-alpha-glucosaminide N-acetyltransferase
MMQTTLEAQTSEVASSPKLKPETKRYLALDAYRGFIMLLLASEGFGFSELNNDPSWGRVARWFNHVPWEGGVFWDMIQPAFMFMVGVAIPFALAARGAQGATPRDNLRHVLGRCIRLIIMSQILVCVGAGRIKLQLIIVLSQIAFTYFLSYLIMQWNRRWQVVASVSLLILWTALLFLFPGPDGAFSKTDHVGLVVDRWIFHYDYDPAYSTLNFIASTVWTLTGVWVGRLLMSPKTHLEKLKLLGGGMGLSFAAGLVLSPWIPMIKQLCTASFVLYSLGWVLFMLIGFYLVIDVFGYQRWTFPLRVLGSNSIFIYSLSMVLRQWLDRAVGVFTFHYHWLGTLAPVAQSCTVLAVMWYACYWLYRRGIFLKL